MRRCTMCPNVCAHWIRARETPRLWSFFMNTNSFFFLFVLATNRRLSCCSPMSSFSLPFASSEDLNTMLLSDVYPTPRLWGDLSASSGTTVASPSTPRDGSLLSPPDLTYGRDGTLYAPGGPVKQDPNAYTRLLRRYQQLEQEFKREREEHAFLK
jgi:hypothetical protein